MRRLPVLLLSVVLAGSLASPASASRLEAAAAPVLPPATPVVAPVVEVQAAPDLVRVGRLRIRDIGLDVAVYRWGCRATDLPNRALRWGCSGTNNQFIAGHAYGVFRPYYRAFGNHRLKRGMVAVFTDARGRTKRYRLAWVRKVRSSYIWNGRTGDQWAWNPTAEPVITLQTCWGAKSNYRIVTRFELP
jgi:hypothetical protein